jgi:hypothetical protein
MDTTPMVSKEISDFGKEAREGSAGERVREYSQGSRFASGLLDQPSSFERGLGGAPASPELSAIKAKYNQEFGQSQRRLNLNVMKQGEEDNLRKIQIANQMAAEEMEINRQKELLRWQRKQAKRAARGQMIGSVLGIVGAGAGMAIGGPGGRAAGGMVGYSVGSGVGNIAGSGGI